MADCTLQKAGTRERAAKSTQDHYSTFTRKTTTNWKSSRRLGRNGNSWTILGKHYKKALSSEHRKSSKLLEIQMDGGRRWLLPKSVWGTGENCYNQTRGKSREAGRRGSTGNWTDGTWWERESMGEANLEPSPPRAEQTDPPETTEQLSTTLDKTFNTEFRNILKTHNTKGLKRTPMTLNFETPSPNLLSNTERCPKRANQFTIR